MKTNNTSFWDWNIWQFAKWIAGLLILLLILSVIFIENTRGISYEALPDSVESVVNGINSLDNRTVIEYQ